ncbi:auxin-binding protein [Trifolium repens]|jgi:oxalate decarboxylase/phosphoglucose isomerase-like protein (cupin superfamily)|nr:auxin-binding protein ABP19a [Trifolium repens]WJX80709.1 auxin-binding protein [Trifolium repens]
MKIIHMLFLFTFISFTICHASVNDFCVADLKAPNTISGYPCKPIANVTSDDFVFHGLVAGSTKNPFKLGVTLASVTNFPALNGLGVTAMHVVIEEGGFAPMHTHPGATELIIAGDQGEATVGIVTPTGVYTKVLKSGDLFVVPPGLMHFVVNTGKGKATGYAAFSSENPSTQIVDTLLFGNKLPSELVAKTTLLDLAQVKKLKALFGGSG